MRRPGNLSGTHYWFGDVAAPPPASLISRKLEEIRLANARNATPLTDGQRMRRITEHLQNPRALMS